MAQRARRLEQAVGQLLHRVLVADPYGRHPDTDPALIALAQGAADASAMARVLEAPARRRGGS